ncbi:MAG: MFS transporter, partial [Actinobacteria bacterium]|nr:MFS transporter [Actinomycetota bacterium]
VLLSGLSVPALALTVGWRAVFAVAVLPALVVTVVGGRLTSDHVPPRARTGHLQTRSRLLVALSAAAALGSMGGNSTAAFLVSAAVAEGVEQGAAGLLLAAASLTSVLIRVTAGGLVDRRGSEGLRACALLLVAGSVGYLLLALSGHWLLVIGALVAMGCGWGWPGVFQFAVVSRNRGAPATATGITQTGVYVGAAAGPVIFGALAGVSYSLAWGLLAVLALAGAAVAAVARRAIDAAPAASGALGAATSARSAR